MSNNEILFLIYLYVFIGVLVSWICCKIDIKFEKCCFGIILIHPIDENVKKAIQKQKEELGWI